MKGSHKFRVYGLLLVGVEILYFLRLTNQLLDFTVMEVLIYNDARIYKIPSFPLISIIYTKKSLNKDLGARRSILGKSQKRAVAANLLQAVRQCVRCTV
jgi:hypothetical protein